MTASPADPLATLAADGDIAAAVGAARRDVDRVRGHRALRTGSPAISAEAARRGALASAALDGASADAGLRVSAELGRLRTVIGSAPLQAVARLHVLAAVEREPASGRGRPRSAGTVVADPLDLGPAPGPDELAVRLADLARLLTARTDAPALVVAAVAHGELLALRPFRFGSGVVARAVSRLVLLTRGFDPGGVTVPDVGHRELGEAYAEGARAYASGTQAGVATWVRHCAEAASLGAREGLAICESVVRG